MTLPEKDPYPTLDYYARLSADAIRWSIAKDMDPEEDIRNYVDILATEMYEERMKALPLERSFSVFLGRVYLHGDFVQFSQTISPEWSPPDVG